MSKHRQSNKEPRKQAALTPKEKKSAKHAVKPPPDTVRSLPRLVPRPQDTRSRTALRDAFGFVSGS